MTALDDLKAAAEGYAASTGLQVPATKQTADAATLEASAVAFAKAEGYAPPPTPPPPTGGTPGIGIYSLGGSLASVANPSLYSLVIGDAWDNVSILQHVAGRGLAYFSPTVCHTNWSSGVPYTVAESKGWLLKNAAGSYMQSKGYSSYAADFGSTAYQQAWISNVRAYLAAHPGIAGVFLDTMLLNPTSAFGGFPTKYPNETAWSAAQVACLKAITDALHADGHLVYCNATAYIPGDATYNDGTQTIRWWKMLLPYADGLMDEYHQEASGGAQLDKPRSLGTAWYQHWDGWQRLIPLCQAAGKAALCNMYGAAGDVAAMQYGKASFLMEWDGGGSCFLYEIGGPSHQDTTSNPAWTRDIGKPSGAKVAVGSGVMRHYAGGVAVINPSPSASQAFSLGGTYYDLAGASHSSVTLGPTTAMILHA